MASSHRQQFATRAVAEVAGEYLYARRVQSDKDFTGIEIVDASTGAHVAEMTRASMYANLGWI